MARAANGHGDGHSIAGDGGHGAEAARVEAAAAAGGGVGQTMTKGKAARTTTTTTMKVYPLFSRPSSSSGSIRSNGNGAASSSTSMLDPDPSAAAAAAGLLPPPVSSKARLPRKDASSASSRVDIDDTAAGSAPQATASTCPYATAVPVQVGSPALPKQPGSPRSPVTPPRAASREIIEISDSPMRELPPPIDSGVQTVPSNLSATVDSAAREAKRARKAAAAHQAHGWEPLRPSATTMHVGVPTRAEEPHRNTAPPHRQRFLWSEKGKGREIQLDDSITQRSYPANFHEAVSSRSASCMAHAYRHQLHDSAPAEASSGGGADMAASASTSDLTPDPDNLWTTTFAPTTTKGVLGESNRRNAEFLKRWVRELSLRDEFVSQAKTGARQSPLKRRVQREVIRAGGKKRRKASGRRRGGGPMAGYGSSDDDDLAEFIAEDDEEEEDDGSECSFDQDLQGADASGELHGQQHSLPVKAEQPHLDQLTNLILLTGPSGSGKTSTVYAVARELQWQVFEVFPGIGKRGPKDLNRYVGMVGQNHLVSRDPFSANSNIFRKGKAATQPGPAHTTVQQSLILIEEVDLLFLSDAGFWDGVIELVAKSRRPVVLTCNDTSSIPLDLLPLQATLQFSHLPRQGDSAVDAFLQAIDRPPTGSQGREPAAQSKAPGFANGSPVIDLRNFLMNLQFTGSTSLPNDTQRAHSATDSASPVEEAHYPHRRLCMLHAARVAETLSWIDAELATGPLREMDDREQGDVNEEDVLLEHPGLICYPARPALEEQPWLPLPSSSRQQEMSDTILGEGELDRHQLDSSAHEEAAVVQRRVDEMAATLLNTFHTPSWTSGCHLDVAPFLRMMVAADDAQQAAFNIAMQQDSNEGPIVNARLRRSTRRAAAERYQRYTDVDDGLLTTIRASSSYSA